MLLTAMMLEGDEEAIKRFHELRGAWLMMFTDGWYAYCGDEEPIGPFAEMVEAARAGLGAWAKKRTAI